MKLYVVKCKVGQGQISKTRLKMSDKPFMKMKWYFKVFILNWLSFLYKILWYQGRNQCEFSECLYFWTLLREPTKFYPKTKDLIFVGTQGLKFLIRPLNINMKFSMTSLRIPCRFDCWRWGNLKWYFNWHVSLSRCPYLHNVT